jgi:hypothetical protein
VFLPLFVGTTYYAYCFLIATFCGSMVLKESMAL